MPLTQIVAVKDLAVGAYMRPIFVPSNGVAIRSFRDEVNRTADDNNMQKHPQDFELYHLGQFDDETGVFDTSNPAGRIARAIDMKEQTNG